MIKVTFDTNVWRPVSSPDAREFPELSSIDIECFKRIHEAVKAGKVAAYIAVVVFTVEAIKRSDRQSFMEAYEPKVEGNITPRQDEMIGLSFSIGPDIKAHHGNNPYLYKYLNDALGIGFKILGCPRVGGIANPDIVQSYFAHESKDEMKERLNLFAQCAEEIERIGAGISHAIQIGKRYSIGDEPWHKGIKRTPLAEAKRIAEALAEWADGDAIAAHVGYKNDYFCTKDEAKSAGASSVLSRQNRAILRSKFGVKFISPQNLCNLIV